MYLLGKQQIHIHGGSMSSLTHPGSSGLEKSSAGLERKRNESMDKATAESLAAAVRAHLKGDPASALEALRASATGEKIHPDVLSARAHLSMELKRYEE